MSAAKAQPSLFDKPPIARGSKSSAAGACMAEKTVVSKRRRVLDCVVMSRGHGRTRAEIAEHTGIALATVCSAVFKLLQLGEIAVATHTRASQFGVHVEVLVGNQVAGGSTNEALCE